MGITGHDVILEAEMESFVTEALRLSFGKCALQVQVPIASPVQSVEALAGKRIVTSFEVLAGRFFKDIDDRAGLVGDAGTSVEYVGGSVEAACALGLADAVGALRPSSSPHIPTFFPQIRKNSQQLTSWVSR
jgi:ATP phosphoribosyltransferase